MLISDHITTSAIAGVIQLAINDLQAISGQGGTYHGRTIEACTNALTKLNAIATGPTSRMFEERWPTECSKAASQEGWDLFECGGALVQIQRDDDLSTHPDDASALAHVVERAAAGSELHRRALLVSIGLR